MLRLGLPLVALVHVGIGSFLSMQSYFGGTFVEGTGAVVGVGLIRNVAPLMACLTLSGLLAARITPELRRLASRPTPRRAPGSRRTADRPPRRPGRSARPGRRPRLAAAHGPGWCSASGASAVGVLVGWQVSQTMMGVSTPQLLPDVLGHALAPRRRRPVRQGDAVRLRRGGSSPATRGSGASTDDGPTRSPAAACRAACLAAVAILVINSGWFLLVLPRRAGVRPDAAGPAGLVRRTARDRADRSDGHPRGKEPR